MKRPKFTDSHRWPSGGYIPAAATDVRATIKRARKAQEALTRTGGHHPITVTTGAATGPSTRN